MKVGINAENAHRKAENAPRPDVLQPVDGSLVGIDALYAHWFTGAAIVNGKIKLTPELVDVLTDCGITVLGEKR